VDTPQKITQAEEWFQSKMKDIFMPSWFAKYLKCSTIKRPELHEYHEGLVKSTIQVGGKYLNLINPSLKKKFEQIMTVSIHKQLRRLKINWLQAQLRDFKTNMVSLVGEEMKTWGWFLPYMAAVLETIEYTNGSEHVAAPSTPEEVDLPAGQGGIWNLSTCMAFLVSRMIETDRTFYQNENYYSALYNGASVSNRLSVSHARILVKQNWNKSQVVMQGTPSRLIGFFSAAHAMTAGVMAQTSTDASIADLKNRAAAFLSSVNDVDTIMRSEDCPLRSLLIYRKGVFAGVLMHPEQISQLGSIHFLNEQAAEMTFQFSKGLLRRNGSLTAIQLLTKIERTRNAIKLDIMDASSLKRTRAVIESNAAERFQLLSQTMSSDTSGDDSNVILSDINVMSQVSDVTTKQRKVYTYDSFQTFIAKELNVPTTILLSMWYCGVNSRVYVETKTEIPQPADTDRFLTEINIGPTGYRTQMVVQDHDTQLFHAWAPLIVATAPVSQWVPILLMELKPAMAVRHPKYPTLFFFFTLGCLQRKENGNWSV